MEHPVLSYIKKLPDSMIQEIFSFIIPETSIIEFCDYSSRYSINYGHQYQIAYYTSFTPFYNRKSFYDKRVSNPSDSENETTFLSRIMKKNGKHRYYITNEKYKIECQSCGSKKCNYFCNQDEYTKEYTYTSTYIGKNLEQALLSLFC
jgi:hypothetical protein